MNISEFTHALAGPCELLSGALSALNVASDRDAVFAIVARAAKKLARVDFVCLTTGNDDSALCTPTHLDNPRSEIVRTTGSWLQRTASIVDGRQRAAVARDFPADNRIIMPGGMTHTIGTVVAISTAEPRHEVLAFVWRHAHAPDVEAVCALEVLACAASLALRAEAQASEVIAGVEHYRQVIGHMQHRLRNSLAFVRSILRATSQTAESPEDFALHLEGRIGAIARAQSTLALCGAAGVELEELVRSELAANAAQRDRYLIRGPSVRLAGRAAETMALALHELTTNSIKFGALLVPGGRIAVTWSQTSRSWPHIHFTWSESGVTIASVAPRRRGFGHELIERTLPYELNAKTRLAFVPGGIRCTIDLPFERRARHDTVLEGIERVKEDTHESQPTDRH